MHIVIIIMYFFIFQGYSTPYLIEDTATIEIHGKVKLTEGSEFSIISINGHWKDNAGSFGSSNCYGRLETKKKLTLVLDVVCKKESLKGIMFTRGGRTKSLKEAGIGIIDIIDGTGIYKKLIGNKCKYAVSYFKKNIQYQTKCDFDVKILTN